MLNDPASAAFMSRVGTARAIELFNCSTPWPIRTVPFRLVPEFVRTSVPGPDLMKTPDPVRVPSNSDPVVAISETVPVTVKAPAPERSPIVMLPSEPSCCSGGTPGRAAIGAVADVQTRRAAALVVGDRDVVLTGGEGHGLRRVTVVLVRRRGAVRIVHSLVVIVADDRVAVDEEHRAIVAVQCERVAAGRGDNEFAVPAGRILVLLRPSLRTETKAVIDIVSSSGGTKPRSGWPPVVDCATKFGVKGLN